MPCPNETVELAGREGREGARVRSVVCPAMFRVFCQVRPVLVSDVLSVFADARSSL